MTQLGMIRTLLAVIAGVFAGILHIEGLLLGLTSYIGWQLVGSGIVWVHVGCVETYFPKGKNDLLMNGFFSGMMTFVLVWTLVYDLVYIF